MAAGGFRQLFHLTTSFAYLHFSGRMPAQLGAKQFHLLLQQSVLLQQFIASAGKKVVFAVPFHDAHRFAGWDI